MKKLGTEGRSGPLRLDLRRIILSDSLRKVQRQQFAVHRQGRAAGRSTSAAKGVCMCVCVCVCAYVCVCTCVCVCVCVCVVVRASGCCQCAVGRCACAIRYQSVMSYVGAPWWRMTPAFLASHTRRQGLQRYRPFLGVRRLQARLLGRAEVFRSTRDV